MNKIIHCVDFVNRNIWFEEYLDHLSDLGVRQEIVMLKGNRPLEEYANSKGFYTQGPFKFCLKSIFGVARNSKSNYVLAHGYIPSVVVSLLVPFSRIKLVIVHHHQPNFFRLLRTRSFLKGFLHGSLSRFTYNSSFAIQSFSEEVRESLLDNGVPTDKIFINPIGINLDRLKEFSKPIQHVDHFANFESTIVSVSRLSWEKNLALAIKAVVLARDSGMRIRYNIYGDGPERRSLEDLIGQHNANDYITLMGYDSNILEVLHSADLFLHTSQTESYGQVIFEAYCIGVPVLTSRVGVAIDLYKSNNKRILLIQKNDPLLLANQICESLKSGEFKEKVNEDFSNLRGHSIEKSTTNLVKFLQISL